ncbi:hypothetical protein [Pseudonocardia humida]|uniref:Uncharacterized protein n=1 Tax=Pseudonocardia humida TaxID=2800819 RepID=A0ABT1A9S6_9PSEU|nr:hypothetical protein [Pseudonocardia humida]MCO1659787.1 hypothetical protein [Pseudonocardia humida]
MIFDQSPPLRPDRRTAGAEKEIAMPTIPLPERPSVEQLKKQAKALQRAVRSGDPRAVALIAEHHLGSVGPLAGFPLGSAQLVTARRYGFASWSRLRRHLEDRVVDDRVVPMPPVPAGRFSLTVEDRYGVRADWVSADDIERCARAATDAHPDPAQWRPVLTARQNGVRVVAFSSPAGPLFGELTPTTVTLSRTAPIHAGGEAAPAEVLFHTTFGTLAGPVSPEVTRLGLERPADRKAREAAVVAGGVFVVPNAFRVTPAGLVVRVNGARVGDLVPLDALPDRAVGVVDRPAPRADRDSPAGRRLAAVIAAADAPPVVDPDQWVPGVHAQLTAAERIQLGRYGRLLAWHLTGADEPEDPFVFDFGPRYGPVQDFAVRGATVAATRLYYDFHDNRSGALAVVGLVDDPRVASIVLHGERQPSLAARIAGGTFLICGPELTELSEQGRVIDRLTVRDSAGTVLEDVPYQQ